MRRYFLAIILCLLPLVATAQEDQTERDRSYLTGLLEDNLSGAGRTIRIDGFAGALSSRATFDQMTIADDQGVWLTINKGAISWTRSALLAGRLEIDELSAEEILVPRLPGTDTGGAPTPEAKPFALPELPVSVSIGTISAKRVDLGEALFGAAAKVSLTGSLQLESGEGSTTLSIKRVDGKQGDLSLTGSYANATRTLSMDLLVSEGPDGIAANMIGLPGKPAVSLAVAGTGPIDDFAADIRLTSDKKPRLSGKVTLKTVDGAQTFKADLGGDIAPLLPPEYQSFFGDQVQLLAEGARQPSGRLSLPVLSIDSQALDLTGAVEVLPSGLPERADLSVKIGLDTGAEVLLPLAGNDTWVKAGRLKLGYDKTKGDGWTLDGKLEGFRRDSVEILALRLSGSGRIGQRAGQPASVGGTVDYTASGINMADPALNSAVGPFLSGRTLFHWQQGGALQLPQIKATGRGYGLTGGLTIDGLASALTITAHANARHSDLSYLSGLAARALSGRADATIEGNYTVLTGAFDGEAKIAGTDITTSQPDLDRILAGQSTISVSAKRDETGVTLRSLSLATAALTGQAQGILRSGASDITASGQFPDLAALGRGLRGALTAKAHLTESGSTRTLSLDGTGRGLGINQPEVDSVLAGETRLSVLAEQTGGRIRLQSLALSNPQLDASAKGIIDDNTRRIDVSARLANAALLAPGFPGPVTVQGSLNDNGPNGYEINLAGEGPGGTRAKVTGGIDAGFGAVNLAISGGAETALANAFIAPRSVQGPLTFDLRMAGKPGLSALSGKIIANNARVIAPTLGLKLDDVDVAADLSGGAAQLAVEARLSTGGSLRVTGPVKLTAPFAGDLTVALNQLHLRDPDLYDTKIDGSLAVNGPLTGGARISGALVLLDTELRVPSTGLGGIAAIPDMTHVNEPAAVHTTRARAGLLAANGDADKRPTKAFPLDVTIAAPRALFVRGRGLDAELGGQLRLRGTTANVVPTGEFNLIRGRLDILGKRFTLDEGQVALQGALLPWIRFVATTKQTDVTTMITIEGDATEPKLSFTSSPELPEEEVLARLLFNRSLTTLSPLQAAQLASAVATLAGKGGEGIVSKLRKGFGLDDLDVGTDVNGNAQLRAGKYLSENLYSDVTVAADGTSSINLNLDVTPSLTARGSLGSDGNSGIGLYYEKDY
ncbi:translocation/assembly module TamB domain-containing protein [Phaeovulum sp.]|uniref:translocation/assembly module TamB domain-containing protein n=1 Tax=Phaeovulum sp. TaxID=2934796 RepID=UPI0039E4120A